tara:strand:+ start:589 stop:897 length:309 start_codon:yes stop_codon:yes gene_type:complete
MEKKPIGRPRNPDREAVARNISYNNSRSQARYRSESWSLDKETYFRLWNGMWDKRGRTMESYCMIQTIPGEGWHEHNVEIVCRREFITVIQKINNKLSKDGR